MRTKMGFCSGAGFFEHATSFFLSVQKILNWAAANKAHRCKRLNLPIMVCVMLYRFAENVRRFP